MHAFRAVLSLDVYRHYAPVICLPYAMVPNIVLSWLQQLSLFGRGEHLTREIIKLC
jgi:hypothetical protein